MGIILRKGDIKKGHSSSFGLQVLGSGRSVLNKGIVDFDI